MNAGPRSGNTSGAATLNRANARLWRWVLLCGAAEFAGIGLAALWYGAIALSLGEPDNIVARLGVWLLMTMAAVPEGFVLGGLQARGLRWFLPDLVAPRFVGATIAAGLIGWGVGNFIPLFVVRDSVSAASSATEPSALTVAGFAAAFGVIAGVVFGACQAWALSVKASSHLRWTVANAVGWAFALPLIFVAAQIAADLNGVAPKILLWALGGGGAGLIIGVATAVVLPTMEPEPSGGLSAIAS